VDSFEEPGSELWLIQLRQQELIREAAQYRLARAPSDESADLLDRSTAVAVAEPNPVLTAIRRAFSASAEPPCDDPCPDCVGC
jgi:hypothetical protein